MELELLCLAGYLRLWALHCGSYVAVSTQNWYFNARLCTSNQQQPHNCLLKRHTFQVMPSLCTNLGLNKLRKGSWSSLTCYIAVLLLLSLLLNVWKCGGSTQTSQKQSPVVGGNGSLGIISAECALRQCHWNNAEQYKIKREFCMGTLTQITLGERRGWYW